MLALHHTAQGIRFHYPRCLKEELSFARRNYELLSDAFYFFTAMPMILDAFLRKDQTDTTRRRMETPNNSIKKDRAI